MNPQISPARPTPQKPPDRAVEFFQATLSEYNFIKTQLKPNQFAKLVGLVGGKPYEVFQISIENSHIKMSAKDENADIHILLAPVEQVAFDIVVSKKTKENEGFGVKFMGFKPVKTDI